MRLADLRRALARPGRATRWRLARLAALAVILGGAVVFPGVGPSAASRPCRADGCVRAGRVLWSRPLAGSWIAQNGIEGTVPRQGQAFAGAGDGVVAVGVGLVVEAFAESTGAPLWTTTLSGPPAGSAIASVRAWPGVVTVGVTVPSAGGGTMRNHGAARRGSGPPPREEFVLDAASGRQLRAFPAAVAGGAVSAGERSTVVVGPAAVTSYRNATGSVAWRVATGASGQAWRVDGTWLYVTVSAHGVIGAAPVTAVRRINLRTGSRRLIRPRRGAFDGALSAVVDGVLCFSGAGGLSLYSAVTGRLLARRAGAVPEGIDPVRAVLYAYVGGALVGIDPRTGANEPGTLVPRPPATYGVRDGVALGLDPGPSGAAWGYSVARSRVVWTTRSLPWPHYFVDLSGLGGGTDQASGVTVVAACVRTGGQVPAVAGGSAAGLACLRPELVAIDR